MLDESKYIESVWNRYNEYCRGTYKNDFYETRVYREERDVSRILKVAAMITLCVTTSLGAVYAGMAIYNNYIKNAIYIEDSNKMISRKWIEKNMNFSNEDTFFYYKAITSYSEYQEYKDKFKTEDFSESDFVNNFVILMYNEIVNIESVTTDEETIYINYKSEYEEKQNVNTLLLPKEQYRENIKFVRVEDEPKANIALQDIKSDYSKEQAIADGCVVLENDKIISNNENLIYEFVEKSKNGEEAFIRIVKYYTDGDTSEVNMKIADIECNNKINMYSYKIIQNGQEETNYKKQYKDIIIKEEMNKKSFTLYNDEKAIDTIIKY